MRIYSHFPVIDGAALLLLLCSNVLWLLGVNRTYAIGSLFVGWLTAIGACVLTIIKSLVYMGLPGSWRAVDMWWDGIIPMLIVTLLLTWIPLRSWCRVRKQFSFAQYKWVFVYTCVACGDMLLAGSNCGLCL